LAQESAKDPTRFAIYEVAKYNISDPLPPIFGVFLPGGLSLYITNPYMLEEIFIKKNSFHTKHQHPRKRFA